MENSGGVIGEVGECGDADVELLARERRSVDKSLRYSLYSVFQWK